MCLLHRDSTLSYKFGKIYERTIVIRKKKQLLKTQWLEEGNSVAAVFLIVLLKRAVLPIVSCTDQNNCYSGVNGI